MPSFVITSPEGKKFRINAPEGADKQQALAYFQQNYTQAPQQAAAPMGSQRYAEEDAAQKKQNQEANFLQQFGTGVKAAAGRTVLGATELASNVGEFFGADPLMDRQVLAEAQRGAKRMDEGTGAAGVVGNIAGDVTTYIPLGKALTAGKVGLKALFGFGGREALKSAVKTSAATAAKAGALSGLLSGTGDEESTIGSNLGNAAASAAIAAPLGALGPVIGYGAKKTGQLVGGGANRVMAALGNEAAGGRVAIKNIAGALDEAGITPGQVENAVAAYQEQGIKGGTLGQMLQSPDLMAREKNLLQSGGAASRVMAEGLKEQPRQISESVINKAGSLMQPEQTSYLYKQTDDIVKQSGAATKELPFTLQAISEDLGEVSGTIPQSVENQIKRILATTNANDFASVDKAKQKFADLYNASAGTKEEKMTNRVVETYRKMLDESLTDAAKIAGAADVYGAAKVSARRDMAMRDIIESFKGAKGQSVKTALNKFFGSIDQQEEFLRKLPDDNTRKEFIDYLASLENVSSRFGGSDTASNEATKQVMNAETGLGMQANVLNPQNIINTISAPFSKTIRKAQAEISLNPDAEAIAGKMRSLSPQVRANALPATVTAQQANKEQMNMEGSAGPTGTERLQFNQPVAPLPVPQQPVSYLEKLSKVESGNNPNARAKTSSASGLYQFTDGTWKDMVSKYGSMTGIGLKDKNDPEAQNLMAQVFTSENAKALRPTLGREPTEGELYIAHFLGANGAKKLIKAIGSNKDAALLFPKEAMANRSIFFDGAKPRKIEQVYELLTKKMSA